MSCRKVKILNMLNPMSMAVAIALSFLLTCSAWAGFKPRVSVANTNVMINNAAAIKFKVGNGSLTPARRAEITAERLKTLVALDIDPRSLDYVKSRTIVTAKGDKLQARIYVGDTMICIATAADAKANHTDPLSLAVSWASNIRSLLLMPPVILSNKQITIPLGESRRIAVGGAAQGKISLEYQNESIATVSAGTGRYVQISGKQLGDTSVDVSVEGEHATLSVSVRKYAGRLANKAVAEVTGNPCPISTICYAARQAIARSVIAEPGARVEIGSVDCRDGALPSAGERNVKVDVRINGKGYIPFSTKADVDVRNVPMPRDKVTQLFYSNDPEQLLKYQVLFAGKLTENSPTRILFHHQNAMGKSVHFLMDVINPSQSPIKVKVARAVSGPLTDTVLVGYQAGLSFLKDDQTGVSIIETIPPESRLVLVSDILANMDTTSGIIQLTQISGSQVYVRIVANPPGVDEVMADEIAPAPNPLMLPMSGHVYPLPTKNVKTDYVVGKRWAFIPIGKNALINADEQKMLHGNYGVIYQIDVKVENPTDVTKKVIVLFDPSAGLASGVFIIDGEFVSTKYVKPPDEFALKSYQLRPGEVRYVRILTLPVAGSNYPATLIVRS